MAFRITRAERAELDELLQACKELHNAANDAIRVFNEKCAEYREALDGVVTRVTDEYDERSDKWRESDRGVATQQWIDDLAELRDAAEEEQNELDELDWINNADDLSDQPEE